MKKKQLIMDKSLELFAEQGIEATSIQQITDRCGISKGAFYLSFKSKDELISALVDHFMTKFISDIDYTVRNTKDDEILLHEFYRTSLRSFRDSSNFVKTFIKEQTHPVHEELISKVRYYNQLVETIILSMVERLYGSDAEHTKYDLVYCIKGFMNMYGELLLFSDMPLDFDILSQSLAEKTNILAKHTTIPFITNELFQLSKQPSNREELRESIIEMIEQNLDEIKESIEKESLILLREELLTPSLHPVLVKGLIENIRNHPHCKWISYLLRNYFTFY